jgi:hypothetical protein
MNNLEIEILKKYNNPTIGLTAESMAKEFNLSVNEIEEVINDLKSHGFLENKELKSRALGTNPPSRNIIVISYLGKSYLNKNN